MYKGGHIHVSALMYILQCVLFNFQKIVFEVNILYAVFFKIRNDSFLSPNQ